MMGQEQDFDLGSSMEETYTEMQGGGTEDAAASTPTEASPPPTSAPDAAPTQQMTPAQAEAWRSLPKAWKKEMESHWGKLPPEVMQYAHEREKQALDGIMQYKQGVDKWNSTMEPFKQWFDHYKIDPHDAFKRLASSHIVLKYGKPEDRRKWAQQLVQDYGLAEVLGGQAGQPNGQSPAPQDNEQLRQFQQELEHVKDTLYQAQLKENIAAVNKFFSDPANEYAADLQEDILRIFEQGSASTLQEAYEKAMWLNPTVRQKLMQKEIENATKPKRPGPSNVKSSSVAPAPTEDADESIDETLKATLNRIQSR